MSKPITELDTKREVTEVELHEYMKTHAAGDPLPERLEQFVLGVLSHELTVWETFNRETDENK